MENTLLVLNQMLKAACAKAEDGISANNEVDCYRYTMKMKESVRNGDIYVNAIDFLSGKKKKHVLSSTSRQNFIFFKKIVLGAHADGPADLHR